MWEPFQDQLPPGVAWEAPFGPAVEITESASLIDRLVAWNGRTP